MSNDPDDRRDDRRPDEPLEWSTAGVEQDAALRDADFEADRIAREQIDELREIESKIDNSRPGEETVGDFPDYEKIVEETRQAIAEAVDGCSPTPNADRIEERIADKSAAVLSEQVEKAAEAAAEAARSQIRENYEKGKEFEDKVEESLKEADVNYSSQEMDASLIIEKDVFADFILRTDDGARVAIIEAKSGACDESRQAQVLLELAEAAIEKTVIYVTPTGTTEKFSEEVQEVLNNPDVILIDGDRPIDERLAERESFRTEGDLRVAVIVCTADEAKVVCRELVDKAHEKENAPPVESNLAEEAATAQQETFVIQLPSESHIIKLPSEQNEKELVHLRNEAPVRQLMAWPPENPQEYGFSSTDYEKCVDQAKAEAVEASSLHETAEIADATLAEGVDGGAASTTSGGFDGGAAHGAGISHFLDGHGG